MSTWVLLRGLMRETRHWGEFPAIFKNTLAADVATGIDVIALDLPGNGRLHQEESPTRVEQMVAHCRRQLRVRGIAPPYHLLAISLGAMVAVAWCACYPDEVNGAVLINTSLRPFSPFHHRLRPHNYPDLLGLALCGSIEKQEKLILRLTSCIPDGREELLKTWIGYQREYPVSRRNALRQLLAAARYRAPAEKPATRLLILASAMDQLVDARCSQRLAARWRTDFSMHGTAGHDLALDDGPWIAMRVRDWLAGRT